MKKINSRDMQNKRGVNTSQAKLLDPDWWPAKTMAERCGVTRMAVGAWVRNGRVTPLRVGRRLYVSCKSVVAYLGEDAARELHL